MDTISNIFYGSIQIAGIMFFVALSAMFLRIIVNLVMGTWAFIVAMKQQKPNASSDADVNTINRYDSDEEQPVQATPEYRIEREH